MAWKDTPAGTRAIFWIALIVGLSLIGLFIYGLWFTANFKPI